MKPPSPVGIAVVLMSRFFSSNGANLKLSMKFKSNDISLKHIHPQNFDTIPTLSHGLDRVLFNSGVHFLRDARTNVYNFDPFLRNICQPEEFNFESVPAFIPPSQDSSLHAAAVQHESKFVSSTSSIAPSMSHFYFLISALRPMNLSSRFTGAFEDEPQTFTQMCRAPVGINLRPHSVNGRVVRSIVAEKPLNADEKPTILMQLGNILEKLLTHSKCDFDRMLKGAANPFKPKDEETYNYLQASKLLLRSQLDCHDNRLPKKSFDLKTRATLPIRMDVRNYRDYLSYRLHRTHGLYESFEREFFDLCRSALLKYNFQVRIGDMDGILIAYHNTAELFGFQYLTRAEMDEILYGNVATGDAVFKMILQVFENVLLAITSQYADNEPVRLTFALTKDASKLTIFSESATEDSNSSTISSNFTQYSLTVTNFINGFRQNDISLDPSGTDDWRLECHLQQQKPNLAEFESARRRVTESRHTDGDDSSRVSLPIMRNARRVYPSCQLPRTDGPEILAPWTIV